jgi:hypothetical protein
MSLLPQRKKSAEEIAQLRESFGLPGSSPSEDEVPAKVPPKNLPAPAPVTTAASPPREPKPVKSLRKSEQGPAPLARSAKDNSKIPARRRSAQELNEILRREALGNLNPKPNPLSQSAHLALVIPAYLLVIAGAVGCFFYNLEIQITASCLVAAWLIAAFIFLRKPFSRYHAAFIAVMAFFVTLFGVFHYFPQFLHGT